MLISGRTGPEGWGVGLQGSTERQPPPGTLGQSGGTWKGRRTQISLSLPPSYLLLAPVFDHSQSDARGQVYSGHKGQPSGRRWPRGMEIRRCGNREKLAQRLDAILAGDSPAHSRCPRMLDLRGAEQPLATVSSPSPHASVGAIS